MSLRHSGMTKVLRTESHQIRSLEGSNRGPSHFAALSLVGTTTFLPANHYEDSELQPFVTNSFTRLPCSWRSLRLTFGAVARNSKDWSIYPPPAPFLGWRTYQFSSHPRHWRTGRQGRPRSFPFADEKVL
jgi:hypothetical protein